MGQDQALEETAAALRGCPSALLSTHVNPDGDAVGSVLALAHGLLSQGSKVQIVLADPLPPYCRFLPGAEWITSTVPAGTPDLAIVCDAAGLDRIGPVAEPIARAGRIVEIDHHSIARPFGHVRLVRHEAFATAELIYDLLVAMKVVITPAIATCLLIGVVTDTGAFRFTNVNARAFRLAAALMDAGAELDRIMDQVYDQKSVSSLRLLGEAVSHLAVEDGFASATIFRDDLRRAEAKESESEGVVGYLRSLAGVEVAAVLREANPDEIRISLRGRPGMNVAKIAALFGGGGHPAAAGCTIRTSLAAAEAQLREAVRDTLAAGRPSESAAESSANG